MQKNKPNIAILGATGVVGREITKIIDEISPILNLDLKKNKKTLKNQLILCYNISR